MSRKEARRPGVVQLAVTGKITTTEGARGLEMSLRQFRRLKARYRACAHSGRPRTSGFGEVQTGGLAPRALSLACWMY